MLDEGIIRHSKSPWMALAVFVPEKSGQLRICIDYRELNKSTTKDSYPLPLTDEVQDKQQFSPHLIFIVVPVNPTDQEKLCFVQALAWDYMNSAECPLD